HFALMSAPPTGNGGNGGNGGNAGGGNASDNPFAPGDPIQKEITYYTGHMQFLQTELALAEQDLAALEADLAATGELNPQLFELAQGIEEVKADIADLEEYIALWNSFRK